MHSHHSHSGQFCKHAAGTLSDVVQGAIKQGFTVYGLTEHVPRYRAEDLYPEEHGLTLLTLSEQFESFLKEAHRLRVAHQSEITLLLGCETELINEDSLVRLTRLLSDHPVEIEYLVGSLHHVNGIPIDFDQPTFQKCLDTFSSHENFLCAYFDAQFTLMQYAHPEVIGHMDLCLLYTPSLCLQDYPEAWFRLERNVRFAVEYGALIEVNAAAFRKGWKTAYPKEEVLKLILENNGRLCLSDDSHGPHAVGLNYGRLKEYLCQMGVVELWHLARSDIPNVGGRHVVAVRVQGNWREAAFWKNCV